MKKRLVFAMIAAMTISLAGCGDSGNTGDTGAETSVVESSNSEANAETNGSAETESVAESAAGSEIEAEAVPEAEVVEAAIDLEYATLYDKYVGYTVTIGYPKDAGFTVKEKTSSGVAPKISISDGANELELWYSYPRDLTILTKNIEEAVSKEEIVKEFAAGEMPGYISMKEGKTSASGYMVLIADGDSDTDKNQSLYIVPSNNNWDADAFKEFYDSDTLMTMLESITFEKSDAPDYPGELSYDRLVAMNVDPAGAFEIEYEQYDTYLIRGHIKVEGKELGYVSATVDKNSALPLDEALTALQESKSDKYENASSIAYGANSVNMMRYNNTEEYHGYIDIDGTAVKISVLVKKGTDTSVFYDYVGTVIDGIYIPQ